MPELFPLTRTWQQVVRRRPSPDSTEFVRSVRARTAELRTVTPRQLQDRVSGLRWNLIRSRSASQEPLQAELFALVVEALRRTVGVELYDVQLQAGAALAAGCVAEMQTGEGKTFAVALPACWWALTGEGVHVVTSNAYLAGRDLELLQPAYAALGLSAGLLPERAAPQAKRKAYECDITYGSGYEFGFDFLRDQLARQAAAARPIGSGYLSRLRSPQSAGESMQRGLVHAIVDEVDNVLLDDACSPLVIAGVSGDGAPDAAAHALAREVAGKLVPEVEYGIDRVSDRAFLTAAGMTRIHGADIGAPFDVLERPWAEYVRQALRAEHLLQRDIHYVVHDDEVRIVDSSTGRIFADRNWQDGLHQAIETREGLPVRAERRPLASITRQRFFRQYRRLCGLTGTANGAEREFRQVYRLPVEVIPLHRRSQLRQLPPRYFPAAAEAQRAAIGSIREASRQGRPVLVGCGAIRVSEELSLRLQAEGIAHNVLNGRQDADEAEIIARAGEPKRVTIATNLAGRGTDIKLTATAAAAGGLHVIACGRQRASRIDRQLIGRCARQGAPGTAEFVVSADDPLLVQHAPRLSRQLADAPATGGVNDGWTLALNRVQRQIERRDAAARRLMLERDTDRESILAGMD